MIQISNICKQFGRFTALGGITIHIRPGDSVALWGSNGAGKSTLIRCVLGLFGYQGSITVGGLDVARQGKAARSLIGYVPQELGFYDDLGVTEAIAYFARLKGLGRVDAAVALSGVNLSGHERKRVRDLSGGMKQRLALAIALLGDPPVLILDEVTASLDALGRDEFVGLLARLRHGGRTMLFASHRPDEISALAGRVVMLEAGHIVRECPPEQLQARTHPPSSSAPAPTPTPAPVATDAPAVARDCDAVAASLPPHSIKFRLAPDDARCALTLLKSRGVNARMNGVGVIAALDDGRKMTPMQMLIEARIPIQDFDLLTAGQACDCPEPHA